MTLTEADTQVWVADCDSIVPVSLTPPGSVHRAYAYEKAVKQHFKTFAEAGWMDADLNQLSQQESVSSPSFSVIFRLALLKLPLLYSC